MLELSALGGCVVGVTAFVQMDNRRGVAVLSDVWHAIWSRVRRR